VTYPADGAFLIHVDKVSNSGLLKIFVDDQLALERPLPCGEARQVLEIYRQGSCGSRSTTLTYRCRSGGRASHPRGEPRQGLVAVTRYVFTGCRRRSVRGCLLRSGCEECGVVWIQNGDSTWVNHAQHAAEIRPFPAVTYTLDGFADGEYAVEWWKREGLASAREVVRAAGGKLTLNPGSVAPTLPRRSCRE